MTNFVAKRRTGALDLFADGFHFGSLVDCEVCHLFESSDEELVEMVNHNLEGDMSVREMLAVAKAAYLAQCANDAAIHRAESAAEGAWLRAAEYDAEAQYEMDRDDMRYAA